MSEMDSQRALLDTLMGINRNNDRLEDDIRDWRDRRVCRCFLAGLCPHDLFQNTKADLGACKNFHSESLRHEFETKSGDPFQFDDYVEREFQTYLNDADRVIRRARQRLNDEKVDEPVELEPDNPELLRIQIQIDKMLLEVEKAGEAGEIDSALMLMQTVDSLDSTREKIINAGRKEDIASLADSNSKKLRVCDVCGSFLSVFDSDKRLADHFLGKQHLGYQMMRDAIEAIKERRATGKETQKSKPAGSDHYSERSRDDRPRGRDDRPRGDRDDRRPARDERGRRSRSRSPRRGNAVGGSNQRGDESSRNSDRGYRDDDRHRGSRR
jgi:hypothetical protein